MAEKKTKKVTTEKTKKTAPKKFLTARFFDIIKEVHVTEKASIAVEQNKYIFKVAKNANKIEVKKAVEGIYDVNVEKVTMLIAKSKIRRQGMTVGKKSGFKKAIVTIKQGEIIDFSKK